MTWETQSKELALLLNSLVLSAIAKGAQSQYDVPIEDRVTDADLERYESKIMALAAALASPPASDYDAPTKHQSETRLVPCKPAAAWLGLPYQTLRDLAFRGLVPVVKIGRAWYFDRRDLERLIERQKETIA